MQQCNLSQLLQAASSSLLFGCGVLKDESDIESNLVEYQIYMRFQLSVVSEC